MAYISRSIATTAMSRQSTGGGYYGGDNNDDDDDDFKMAFWSIFIVIIAFVIAIICAYS